MKDYIHKICTLRPQQNESLRQYLMLEKSMITQMDLIGSYLNNKRVLFIGDDDHISLCLSKKYKKMWSEVLEYDERICKNQKRLAKEFGIGNHNIRKYDIRNKVPKLELCDAFYINPPYSLENQGYGIICWISRSLELLKNGGLGIIVIPTDSAVDWVTLNLKRIEKFLLDNNCSIFKIDYNIHEYINNHSSAVKSSNVFIKYLGGAQNLLTKIEPTIYA